MEADEELTLADAARRVGLHPVTLRTQYARGRITAVKKGRDLWVTWSEVQRYLRTREQVGKFRGDVLTDAAKASKLTGI